MVLGILVGAAVGWRVSPSRVGEAEGAEEGGRASHAQYMFMLARHPQLLPENQKVPPLNVSPMAPVSPPEVEVHPKQD